MNLISREELKTKLDRGDKFKLVMTLGEWAYHAKHIPGSLHFNTVEDALRDLKPEDEIIVYCTDPACIASIAAYRELERRGYAHVRRYADGIEDWEAAGYPLAGTLVQIEAHETG
jgi:rhodanese-related sulfurtransferase